MWTYCNLLLEESTKLGREYWHANY